MLRSMRCRLGPAAATTASARNRSFRFVYRQTLSTRLPIGLARSRKNALVRTGGQARHATVHSEAPRAL